MLERYMFPTFLSGNIIKAFIQVFHKSYHHHQWLFAMLSRHFQAVMMRGLDGGELSRNANIAWLGNWIELTKECNGVWVIYL